MGKIIERAEMQLELHEGNEPKTEKEVEIRSEVMRLITTIGMEGVVYAGTEETRKERETGNGKD